VQPSPRLAYGVPSAATNTSTKSNPARSAPWVARERVDVSAAHARRGRRAGVSQTELPALIMREVAGRVGQVDVAVLVVAL
jgi:hypothetical protein